MARTIEELCTTFGLDPSVIDGQQASCVDIPSDVAEIVDADSMKSESCAGGRRASVEKAVGFSGRVSFADNKVLSHWLQHCLHYWVSLCVSCRVIGLFCA